MQAGTPLTVMSPGGSLSQQFSTLGKTRVIYKYFSRGGKISLIYRSQLHKERKRVFIQKGFFTEGVCFFSSLCRFYMGENITADWFWKVSHKFISLPLQKVKNQNLHRQICKVIYFSWLNISMTSNSQWKSCCIIHICVQLFCLCLLLFPQSIWSNLFIVRTWVIMLFASDYTAC